MQKVFVLGSNILSPLGNSSVENFSRLQAGESAVLVHEDKSINDSPFWASVFSSEQVLAMRETIKEENKYSKFEVMMIASALDALKDSGVDAASEKTIFICSTTKGSISVFEEGSGHKQDIDKLNLFQSAEKLSDYFKNPNDPIVISNACISGITAIVVARRMLDAGYFENAVVVGADTISRFVYSGFLSFQALSSGRCKPFSIDRDGINLGEAAATIILSTTFNSNHKTNAVRVLAGSMSNDANHISGPSRTGEELSMAIMKSMKASGLAPDDIGFVSGHGTATLYNDEMEAKAISLSGLSDTPLNSLKGYFGHTLGASGIVESVISIESMKSGIIIPTAGFSIDGLEPAVNVCKKLLKKEIKHCIKIASGFGGCNASVIYSKN